jgi:FAD/FMN-containing dehydrogenase
MNQIICFDKDSGVLVSEAGVVLEAADNYLREQGHIMPIDLGAKGSCVVHTHHPSLNLAVNGLRQ